MNEIDMTVMMWLKVSINAILKERYRSDFPFGVFPWLRHYWFPYPCVGVSRVKIDLVGFPSEYCRAQELEETDSSLMPLCEDVYLKS